MIRIFRFRMKREHISSYRLFYYTSLFIAKATKWYNINFYLTFFLLELVWRNMKYGSRIFRCTIVSITILIILVQPIS